MLCKRWRGGRHTHCLLSARLLRLRDVVVIKVDALHLGVAAGGVALDCSHDWGKRDARAHELLLVPTGKGGSVCVCVCVCVWPLFQDEGIRRVVVVAK